MGRVRCAVSPDPARVCDEAGAERRRRRGRHAGGAGRGSSNTTARASTTGRAGGSRRGSSRSRSTASPTSEQAKAGRFERRGESAIINLSDTNALGFVWDEECRRVLLDHALDELRQNSRLDEKTIRAFELVSLEQRAAAEVAAETGISLDSVYAAKHRCLTLLREILARLNEVYEVA